MNNKSFKIVCHTLGTILLVKNFSDEEIETHYNVISKKIEGIDAAVFSVTYFMMIAKIFLEDTSFLDDLKRDAEENEDADELFLVLNDIYSGVHRLYPMFQLEFICENINRKLFLSSIDINTEDILEEIDTIDPNMIGEPMPENKSSSSKNTVKISSLEDINRLEKYLKARVIGQDEAIEELVNNAKVIASGLYPRGCFFFLGPTGVGKTLLGKLFGKR